MGAVLNELTQTVHKHNAGDSEIHTACGVTHHVDDDQLRVVPVERATGDHGASKCGRCFDDGGGY
jgi:hypothetical protein